MPKYLSFLVLSTLLFACGGPSRTVKITQKFDPEYRANYSYQATGQAEPSGYTIGIIQPEFVQKNPPGPTSRGYSWDLADPREASAVNDFKREIANTVEKILLTKGCKISGPFASYEEMTFPERERCSYLVQPTVILDMSAQPVDGSLKELPEVGGPNLETFCYATLDFTISGNVEMEYVIYDPLTKEKLQRHKLKSVTISKPSQALLQGLVNDRNQCYGWKSLGQWVKERPNYRQAYASHNNEYNMGVKILEELYISFMPQVDQLLSVDEFAHLQKYKDQLKEKKVY